MNTDKKTAVVRKSLRYPWWGRIGMAGGLICAGYYFLKTLGVKIKKPLIPIRMKNVSHPFHGRFNSSDGGVFNQIFIEQEYSCLSGVVDPELIIDCGANVGYSSIWFLEQYPQAKIIAVEPDSSNFELCRKNLLPYGDRVSLIQAGIWPVDAGLVVEAGKGGEEWAFQVRECCEGEKPHLYGVSIDQLLKNSGFSSIDILKIDIETAEKTLFAKNYESWLGKVNNIVIELHNQECEDVFFKAMSAYDYDLSTSGELTVCRNIAAKNPTAVAV